MRLPSDPDKMPWKQRFPDIKKAFVILLGADGVVDSSAALRARSGTEWSPSENEKIPALIVFPRSTGEVSFILKICHGLYIPVTPWGGGTSLDGALATTRGGIVMDLSRINK